MYLKRPPCEVKRLAEVFYAAPRFFMVERLWCVDLKVARCC